MRPELIPVSLVWSGWEYFYSPLDGMLVHRRVTPSILPKNKTQCPRPGLGPGPLDPETSPLTMRSPRLSLGILGIYNSLWISLTRQPIATDNLLLSVPSVLSTFLCTSTLLMGKKLWWWNIPLRIRSRRGRVGFVCGTEEAALSKTGLISFSALNLKFEIW